jgi:hypothetical protein
MELLSMLSIPDPLLGLDHGRLTRREWLRIGGVGLGGLSLPLLLNNRASAVPAALRANGLAGSFGRAKSVIIFGLMGGPPQHETWDPKPKASEEIRGAFGTIETRTPGLIVGELMPHTARLTDKIAVLRAVVTNDNAHSSSGYQMLTGIPHLPLSMENATPKPPNTAPAMGAIARYLIPDSGGMPSAVTLPEHIWNDGNIPWPGQDAGDLGQKFDPWLVNCDPTQATFQIPGLDLPEGVSLDRLGNRRSLQDRMAATFDSLGSRSRFEQFDGYGGVDELARKLEQAGFTVEV